MNIRQILSAAAAALTVGAMAALPLSAQKKPLDHSVYDSWQTVSSIQNPYGGNWLLYSQKELLPTLSPEAAVPSSPRMVPRPCT